MDVLLKLRILIWVLVISLWGVMVYQYLGEDDAQVAGMKRVENPYRSVNVDSGAAAPMPLPAVPPAAEPPAVNAPGQIAAAGGPIGPGGLPPAPPADLSNPAANVLPAPGSVGPAPEPNEEDQSAPPPPPAATKPRRRPAARAKGRRPSRAWREDRSRPLPDPPVPPGFVKSVTRHFNVYAERYPASDQFLELLENLHANLMLDLAPFSPWADDQRVSVFLFKNQDTYRQVTGRPPWSGGASSVPKRKVYVYESDELPGILAHELTHIYYDGFYLSGENDPLWLSEGMATVSQVERGLAAPNWLRENLEILEAGGGFPLSELMRVRTTSGWPDEKVRLWYAESYSVVRYLLRTQYRSSFYKFSSSLRDGRPVSEALYRAYGAPYTRLRALEIAWRHSISAAPAGRPTARR
jgi:hypothetical protein